MHVCHTQRMPPNIAPHHETGATQTRERKGVQVTGLVRNYLECVQPSLGLAGLTLQRGQEASQSLSNTSPLSAVTKCLVSWGKCL